MSAIAQIIAMVIEGLLRAQHGDNWSQVDQLRLEQLVSDPDLLKSYVTLAKAEADYEAAKVFGQRP